MTFLSDRQYRPPRLAPPVLAGDAFFGLGCDGKAPFGQVGKPLNMSFLIAQCFVEFKTEKAEQCHPFGTV